MSYTRYWAIFNHWYIAYTHLYIKHTPCTCRIHGIGRYSTSDTYPLHFYTSAIHIAHVVNTVLGHIQPLIHSLYTFIHQTFTLHMSYTWYLAIFNHWYIAYTLLHIRHTPCTCRIHVHCIGVYTNYWYMALYTFIHQTYTLYMSYTRYFAIFNHWYIAYTLLYIRHSPCTCRIQRYWAIYKWWYMACTHLYIKHAKCTCRIHGIGPYSNIDT